MGASLQRPLCQVSVHILLKSSHKILFQLHQMFLHIFEVVIRVLLKLTQQKQISSSLFQTPEMASFLIAQMNHVEFTMSNQIPTEIKQPK